MKNYNIERILEPAFKLFLMYNYESVSTAKLEEATGLTRGAIFYKYKTKESIFKAVIDRYVLDFHSKPINTNVGKLYDFIDLYLEKVNARMFKMHSMGILNIHRGYFNLLYQAVQYYPNFDIKVTEMFESGLKQWEVVVKHAVESGEIKSSCNAYEVAQTFRYLYSGLSFENSLYLGLDVDRLSIAESNVNIVDRCLWFINPHYKQKFNLKPRRIWGILENIKYVRNFFCTSCFYIIK